MASTRPVTSRLRIGAAELPEVGAHRADRSPILRRSPVEPVVPRRAADVFVRRRRDVHWADDTSSAHSRTGSVSPSRVETARSREMQRIIDDLRGDLRRYDQDVQDRDREIERLQRMIADRMVTTEREIMRKYDRLVLLTERGIKRKYDQLLAVVEEEDRAAALAEFGDEDAKESYCFMCDSRHVGGCSARTRRCFRCGEVGHETSGCQSPPLCFYCKGAGHISTACPKRAARSCFRCGEVGHISTGCTKEIGAGPLCFGYGTRGHIMRSCPKDKGKGKVQE